MTKDKKKRHDVDKLINLPVRISPKLFWGIISGSIVVTALVVYYFVNYNDSIQSNFKIIDVRISNIEKIIDKLWGQSK